MLAQASPWLSPLPGASDVAGAQERLEDIAVSRGGSLEPTQRAPLSLGGV